MSEPLTDQQLARLRRAGGARACEDPRILALLAHVVSTHPRRKIHWLPDDREEIVGGWLQKRLVQGRLAAMIDKAGSVRELKSIAAKDLQQYADEERRRELPTKLFKRLAKLLASKPERFAVKLPSQKPGSTYWTLAERPANAIFSGEEPELCAHVFAVGLVTLPEDPEAKKQSQFLTAVELERYAFEMLERTARALSLDQLILGLTAAYALKPSFTELPDENASSEGPVDLLPSSAGAAEASDITDAEARRSAEAFLAALSPRQIEILRHLREERVNQRGIAALLGCSEATVSSEKDAIACALRDCATPEEQVEVIRHTIELLDGSRS